MGRWKVTVRSATTAGSDGSPDDRSTAVGRVDGDDGDAGRAGAPDDLDGFADRLAERAADAGPEERVDDDRRLVDAEPEHRDVAGDRSVDLDDARRRGRPGPSSSGRVLAGRPAVRGDHRDDDRGAGERQAAGRDVAVAAVVAGAAQDDDRAGAPATEVRGERLDRGRDRRPGMLHEPVARDAEGLRAPVRAGHRLGRDRGQRGAGRPVLAQAAQVHLEDGRIVSGQRRGGVGGSRDEVGCGHRVAKRSRRVGRTCRPPLRPDSGADAHCVGLQFDEPFALETDARPPGSRRGRGRRAGRAASTQAPSGAAVATATSRPRSQRVVDGNGAASLLRSTRDRRPRHATRTRARADTHRTGAPAACTYPTRGPSRHRTNDRARRATPDRPPPPGGPATTPERRALATRRAARSRRAARPGTPNPAAATARAVYGPIPGSASSAATVAGHPTPVVRDDRPGRLPQRQRPPVVAEPGPGRQQLLRPGTGQRRRRRPQIHEPPPHRPDPLDPRLLRHDLGDEHLPRVRGGPDQQIAAARRRATGTAAR